MQTARSRIQLGPAPTGEPLFAHSVQEFTGIIISSICRLISYADLPRVEMGIFGLEELAKLVGLVTLCVWL